MTTTTKVTTATRVTTGTALKTIGTKVTIETTAETVTALTTARTVTTVTTVTDGNFCKLSGIFHNSDLSTYLYIKKQTLGFQIPWITIIFQFRAQLSWEAIGNNFFVL